MVVHTQVHEDVGEAREALLAARRRESRPTAGRACHLRLPALRRGSRAGARREARRRSTRTSRPARPRFPRRRGCCPARHSRRPRARPPSPGSRRRCTWQRVPPRPRSRAAASRDPRQPRSGGRRSPGRNDPLRAARDLPARSAGSPRTAWRLRRRAASPTGRCTRRRGTSTGRRLPTGALRGRRHRSSRSKRGGSR